MLVNNHDPKHLDDEFEDDHAGSSGWENVEKGPTVWRIRISKLTSTPLPRVLTNATDIATTGVQPRRGLPTMKSASGTPTRSVRVRGTSAELLKTGWRAPCRARPR